MSFWTLKKAFDLVNHRILLSKLYVYLNSSNSLPFFLLFLFVSFLFVFCFVFCFVLFVHTLKTDYNVSLSVAPIRLKELLNIVYHKGQSWDLYSSASILMIYLCIYHQILQNAICTTLHTTEKSVVQIQKTLQLCLDRILVWCNVNHMLINPLKTKSMIITTRQKHQLSDLSLRLSLYGQNTENVTKHRLLGLTVDIKFRWQAEIEHICKKHVKNNNCFFFLSCNILSTLIPENSSTTLTLDLTSIMRQ